MEINLPEVLKEVTEQFRRYEQALVTNDIAVLDELFWDSTHTLRYGATECLYGFEEIRAFRIGRSTAGLDRMILREVITSYGKQMATANIEFVRKGSDRIGRQSQTWVKMPQGWRVVAAHISMMD